MITSESGALAERKVALMLARAITYLLYFYVIVVEIILLLGFFLLLFGANPSAGFTQWVYRNLDRVMAPFRGIFTPIQLGTTSGDVPAIFETSVLFAMIIYGIVALALSALIAWLSGRLAQVYAAEEDRRRDEELAQFHADTEARRALAETGAAAQVVVQVPPPPPPPGPV